MELDPTGYYRMPLIMGSLWKNKETRFTHTHIKVVALQYLTDATAIQALLSRPWLAYKYIPSLDGPPDADYPTI